MLMPLAGCGLPFGSDRTTNDEIKESAYPERVEQVGWEWQPPEDARIIDTVPVPTGVAVVLDDGYVVLAGDTGEELWRYRAQDTALAAYASRDGEYLALEVEDSEAGSLLLRLDPSTGEILEESTRDEASSDDIGVDDGSFNRSVDEGTMVVRSSRGPALTALSLETGDPVWTREEPTGCTTADGLNSSTDDAVVLDDVVVEAFTCAPSVVRDFTYTREEDDVVISGLVGRDLRTGEELWRFEEDFGVVAFQSIDHRSLDPLSDRHLVMRTLNSPNVLFDVSTGEVIGTWEGAVIGAQEDGSVVVWYARDGEYRRENPEGTTLTTLPNPTEAIPDTSDVTGLGTDNSIVLAEGIVNSGEHSLGPDAEIWFHGWNSEDSPVVIDVSQVGIEDTEAQLFTTAVPGAVVLSYSEDGDEGRDVLLGLT
ncbi:PQQ-binding-like beta-propeller repeat protein [Nocardiopsis dassonvillei subsp. albirubida]|uniref:PQQ-binding-like beta-propeller repeat protein n=2 Tax=Nocardiopsis alborubida TaxID=146802 RepID=A0A7X6MI40_9ACTN|nr:PQQ-binding-like beta-propeller repeat protein [Nocardiopsis alborubida]